MQTTPWRRSRSGTSPRHTATIRPRLRRRRLVHRCPRLGGPAQESYRAQVERYLARLQKLLASDDPDVRSRANVTLSAMVGAVMIARGLRTNRPLTSCYATCSRRYRSAGCCRRVPDASTPAPATSQQPGDAALRARSHQGRTATRNPPTRGDLRHEQDRVTTANPHESDPAGAKATTSFAREGVTRSSWPLQFVSADAQAGHRDGEAHVIPDAE